MERSFKLEKLGVFKFNNDDYYAFYNAGINGVDYYYHDKKEKDTCCVSIDFKSLTKMLPKYNIFSEEKLKNQYEDIYLNVMNMNIDIIEKYARLQVFEEELYYLGVLTDFKDFEFGIQ